MSKQVINKEAEKQEAEYIIFRGRPVRNNQWDEKSCDVYQVSTEQLKVANIGDRFKNSKFSIFPDSEYKRKTAQYMTHLNYMLSNGIGIMYFGQSGEGKTSLSVIVSMEALRQHYTVHFIRSSDYVNSMSNKYNNTAWEIVYHRVRDVDLLIFDDLGKEYKDNYGHYQNHIIDLIRFRSDHLKSTIITTNNSVDDLEEYYSISTTDLFGELFHPLEVTGNDFRVKKAELLENLFN